MFKQPSPAPTGRYFFLHTGCLQRFVVKIEPLEMNNLGL